MLKRTALLALAAALAAAPPILPAAAEPERSLIIVVTAADPQAQAMALVLAGQALRRGEPTRLLLCGPGGAVALKDHAGPELRPMGRTPRQMLEGLIAAGAKAEVCALFLPNSGGRTQADLVDGVGAATPAEMDAAMARPGARVLAF